MSIYEHFTGLYPITKTLRFELKPIGKTLEYIEKKGLIARDERRAEEYEKVKEIIDRYHRRFIRMCLEGLVLKLKSDGNKDSLEDYVEVASNPSASESLDKVKDALRKQVVDAFKKGGSFADLFKKELITKHLMEIAETAEEKRMIGNFAKFTTYFKGFHENRRNMYSAEAKSTAIAYRIIHENLPMFLDNMRSFERIAESELGEHFLDIEKDFSEYLNVEHLSEMFQLDYFTDVLTQKQIDVYNGVIGGRTEKDGVNIKGLNEYVNQYNQKHRDNRLPLLKPLYKMMLGDKAPLSWLPEEFVSDDEMIGVINETYNLLRDCLTGTGDGSLRNLLQNIDKYDAEHIYISNDTEFTDISQQIYGHYDTFTNSVKDDLRKQVTPTPKERRSPELYDKRIDELFKSAKSFSIAYLNSCLGEANTIQNYFKQLGAYNRNGKPRNDLFQQIEMAYIAANDVLAGKHSDISQSEADVALIKNLLDTYKALQRFVKPLLGKGDEADKDNEFDARLRTAWGELDKITPLYNNVRNWLTRKPYSVEKIKLNFDNAELLEGWDKNNETARRSVLLRRSGQYYLAIMDMSSNKVFTGELPNEGECYEKMDYKQMALPLGFGAFVRKCFGTAKSLGWHCPSHLLDASGKIIIKDEEAKDVLPELIDCYKCFLDIYEKNGFMYKDYGFKFMKSSEYEKLSQFFKDVSAQGYKMTFRSVSVSFINHLVDEGKIYLFQIWNKDFSAYSKGTPNMHTLYWKMLFDERNLADAVYQLNGKAEMFYRKKSLDLDKTTIHRSNKPVINKNKQGKKCESTFDYDIIKDRRYTVDKFQFHVPIAVNFKATGNGNINEKVQELICNNGIEHVIGIDRGERHLLYLSLIDLRGNIVKQMTLNDIVNEYQGNTYSTNYKELLSEREGSRTEARRNWKKIENIKDIKEGYLSQVIHILSKMMVDNNAIVVLEDLNMGFMRGRQKIERNVYEQFEKKLIDKLNYYVDKRRGAGEVGGVLHALQMANKFESFKKLGKQSGFLFYIPAWNTSKIDPVTGFVNLFDTRYENVDNARLFFSRFDTIRYNAEKDWFEFVFDYSKFTTKADGTRSQWTLCTYGTRIKSFHNPAKQNQWDNEEIVLTDKFRQLFQDAGININGNLKEAICGFTDAEFFKELMRLMKLMLQMRNSEPNTEIDYILSPVADEDGHFYDSRTCSCQLPKDADANGAYNIARKGLWVIRRIQQEAAAGRSPKLAISNKEWLQFAQQKPYLND